MCQASGTRNSGRQAVVTWCAWQIASQILRLQVIDEGCCQLLYRSIILKELTISDQIRHL